MLFIQIKTAIGSQHWQSMLAANVDSLTNCFKIGYLRMSGLRLCEYWHTVLIKWW